MSDFKNENVYYDLGKILSYNKLISISIGARGLGKSYAAKRWAINNWLKNKKQFIYIRRYKTEFNNIKNYFSDIQDRYPEHSFEVKGGEFIIDGDVAGYYLSLSTSQTQKSNSFPDVTCIIFDEFIIDKGRITYIKGEVQLFLDMIETIGRMRDDIRVLMISNAISSINPYFLYFNISPRKGDIFIQKDEIIVEINKNKDFADVKKQTKFGRLIADTHYGAYSIDNEFLRDDRTFINKMSGKCICWYALKYLDSLWTVWYSEEQAYVYITDKKAPPDTEIYAITTEDHMPNALLLSRSNIIFKKLKMAYEYGQIRFTSLHAKSAFCEIIDLL